MRTQQPAQAVSVAAQKIMSSAPACLLHIFEISSANDQNLSELMSGLSELMPFGMGSFAELMPFDMGCFQSLCLWHGFGLAWLMPFGMGKVNIAQMTLYEL